MPAMDALFAKQFYREELQTPLMKNYLKGFLKSFATSNNMQVNEANLPAFVGEFLSRNETWMDASEAFYVAPQMSELVTAASETMPDEPLLPQDLPTQQGFVLIPGALTVIDVRGMLSATSAVLWSAFGGIVRVILLTDKYDPTDRKRWEIALGKKQAAEYVNLMPRYTPWHIMDIGFGQALPLSAGPDMLVPPDYGLDVTYKTDPKTGQTDVALISDKGYSHEELAELFSYGTRPDPVAKWLVTMWRLMQQTLTVVEKEYPTRQQRRQLERRNAKDRHVSVITLRRKKPTGHGDVEVEWSHRHLRRGHWRNQWYGSGPDKVQRAIWIHPTICGPEDKPLLVREHIYALER